MHISSPFSVQTLSLLLLHDLTTSLLVFSHSVSFQRYKSTYETSLVLTSLPSLLILLLIPPYSRSPIILPSSSHLLFFSFFVSSFSFLPFSFFSSFFCFFHSSSSCSGLYCFLYFSGHLIIFTSPVL